MEQDWRDLLSMYIEDLDKQGCIQLTSVSPRDKKLLAAMEAAVRFASVMEQEKDTDLKPIHVEAKTEELVNCFKYVSLLIYQFHSIQSFIAVLYI
jgi:hypothetical protein